MPTKNEKRPTIRVVATVVINKRFSRTNQVKKKKYIISQEKRVLSQTYTSQASTSISVAAYQPDEHENEKWGKWKSTSISFFFVLLHSRFLHTNTRIIDVLLRAPHIRTLTRKLNALTWMGQTILYVTLEGFLFGHY